MTSAAFRKSNSRGSPLVSNRIGPALRPALARRWFDICQRHAIRVHRHRRKGALTPGCQLLMAGSDWSRDEVEATVADYFEMLRKELAGLGVNKAEHNARLRRFLADRPKGSVEFKHANISAVLTLYGYPYIEGYKPRFNFQALLEQVVLEFLDVHREFFDGLLDGPLLNPAATPAPGSLPPERLVEPPPERMPVSRPSWAPDRQLIRLDFVARDAANRELGRRGEEFVFELERRRLHDGGRPELAARIEWTAQTRGDGAGYDIQSYGLEVKTTGLGKYFPFNVTANEVRCSEARPHQFHLYRVFSFGPGARLYMLPGSLSASCHLDPLQFRAFVQPPAAQESTDGP